MINTTTIRKTAVTVAVLGSFGLGGAAIAGATDKPADQNRPQRQALSSDVAAKVKAAALEKVPGATVLRTEAGGPYGTAYHAHIKTSDGTRQVVLINASFEATEVQADPRPRRPGSPRRAGTWRRDRADRRGQAEGRGRRAREVPGSDDRAHRDQPRLERPV